MPRWMQIAHDDAEAKSRSCSTSQKKRWEKEYERIRTDTNEYERIRSPISSTLLSSSPESCKEQESNLQEKEVSTNSRMEFSSAEKQEIQFNSDVSDGVRLLIEAGPVKWRTERRVLAGLVYRAIQSTPIGDIVDSAASYRDFCIRSKRGTQHICSARSFLGDRGGTLQYLIDWKNAPTETGEEMSSAEKFKLEDPEGYERFIKKQEEANGARRSKSL